MSNARVRRRALCFVQVEHTALAEDTAGTSALGLLWLLVQEGLVLLSLIGDRDIDRV